MGCCWSPITAHPRSRNSLIIRQGEPKCSPSPTAVQPKCIPNSNPHSSHLGPGYSIFVAPDGSVRDASRKGSIDWSLAGQELRDIERLLEESELGSGTPKHLLGEPGTPGHLLGKPDTPEHLLRELGATGKSPGSPGLRESISSDSVSRVLEQPQGEKNRAPAGKARDARRRWERSHDRHGNIIWVQARKLQTLELRPQDIKHGLHGLPLAPRADSHQKRIRKFPQKAYTF